MTVMSPHPDGCRSLIVAAVVVFFSTTSVAQRGQDAGVAGTVRDELGAVARGATVTVSSPQLIGGPQSVSTDARGDYRFSFLSPGDYEIVAALDGFANEVRSGLTLRPGLTFTVDFTLRAAPVKETVIVQGPAPMVDVHASSAPTLINRQLLDNLPLPRTPFSGAGTVADVVNLAPGVVQSVALGGTFLSNPLSMEGTSGTEPGYGMPSVHPSPNWIDEVQVVSVGADAQYGEYTGARV